jgi:hypothetical protein
MRRTTGLLALLAVTGVGLVACGDDSTSVKSSSGSGASAQTYVDGVCTALSDIVAKGQAAQTAFTGATDPAQIKQKVQDLVGGMSKSVDDATAKITALGPPKVDNGAQVHQALLDSLKKMGDGLKQVQASAASLDPSSPTSAQGFADVAQKFSDSMNSLGDGLSGLKAPELDAAGKNSPACKKLNG